MLRAAGIADRDLYLVIAKDHGPRSDHAEIDPNPAPPVLVARADGVMNGAYDLDEAIARAEKEKFAARIFAKDATLWKSDEAHTKIINNALGWIHVPEQMTASYDNLIQRVPGAQHLACPNVLGMQHQRRLGAFRQGARFRQMAASSQGRLERLMPMVVEAAAAQTTRDATLALSQSVAEPARA